MSEPMKEVELFDRAISSTQTTNNKSSTLKSLADIGTAVQTNVIDVVENYDWTLSTNKRAIIDTIPYILLREKKLVSSNITTSLFSSLFSLPDALTSNRNTAQNVFNAASQITSMRLPGLADSTLKSIEELIKTGTDIAAYKVNYVYNTLLSQFKPTSTEFEAIQKVLGLLYLTKPTGNVYKFPYFVDELFSIDNSFQDSYQQTPVFDNVDKFAREVSEKMAGVTALTEPGVYIQRPKFYNFSSTGTIINFKVTLFNTLNENMYLQNSDLIAKLLLSNTPRRLDKITVKPPCVYEVVVPGRAFYPYCYIKAFKVNHVGVKRVIIGNNGKRAIVPDAYSIDVTIESLISDINNLYEQQIGNAGIDLDEDEVLNLSSIFSPKTTTTSKSTSTTPDDEVIRPY